jgi:PII-like signaling protein
MEGIYVRIFTTEKQKHDGMLVYEWLLQQAKTMGINGGSALRAIAGYGRHKKLHDQAFYELASDLPVELVFLLSEQEADQLLGLIAREGLSLLYFKSKVDWGFTGT